LQIALSSVDVRLDIAVLAECRVLH
jgi:hypothetical protein